MVMIAHEIELRCAECDTPLRGEYEDGGARGHLAILPCTQCQTAATAEGYQCGLECGLAESRA